MSQKKNHKQNQGETVVDNPHDKGYKHLLSSKKAFIEMLRSFIKEKWVEEIEETKMILVNKSYTEIQGRRNSGTVLELN
jgi:DNA-binding transcriptional regulator GbsR (MarR family)